MPDTNKQILLDSLQFLTDKNKIEVFAFVIMPNHIHFIWRMLAMNGKELPHVSFLKHTAHAFKKQLQKEDNSTLADYAVDAHNKQYEFWQRDSLAVLLYSKEVTYQKLDYIHGNPLKEHWQLAKEPADYYYSSAKFYEQGEKDFVFLKDIRELF
ncbi:MAG: transposase [Sphingobacteriales bacterium]|nr:MAG: transposase [Sphingobacteriales bacterium]